MLTVPDNQLTQDQREQVRRMDINSLTIYLFRWLKKKLQSDPNRSSFLYSVERLRQDLFPGGIDNDSGRDHAELTEAIVQLERRQLLVREFAYPFQPFGEGNAVIYLTSIGRKSDVDDDVLLSLDNPEKIVTALEQKIGRLDDIVRQYYLESLRAYQEGLYISSVICLAAASERAIHWLAEAIGANFQNYQTKMQTKKNGQIAELIKYLSDSVIPNVPNFDRKFVEELKNRLSGLADVYRENRNEAGHPTTIEQSWLRDDQEILLVHFRRYITTISAAIVKCYPKSGVATTV